jgi:hypothetical protein
MTLIINLTQTLPLTLYLLRSIFFAMDPILVKEKTIGAPDILKMIRVSFERQGL